jgi:hypothetical protein
MFCEKKKLSEYLKPVVEDLDEAKAIFEGSATLEDFKIDASVKLEVKGFDINFDIKFPATEEAAVKAQKKIERKEV